MTNGIIRNDSAICRLPSVISRLSFIIYHLSFAMETISLSRRGYTLLEILIAVTLMMIIMLGLTQLFSSVGTQINNTQATLQLVGELRGVKTRLENDLKLVTADLTKAPPMKTGINQGYFCIIEGLGADHSNQLLRTRETAYPYSVTVRDVAYTSDSSDLHDDLGATDWRNDAAHANHDPDLVFPYDNTVGDMDDILMFTASAPDGQPFRGLVNGAMQESNAAEIIWFCRGNTLYRRTLLILPDLALSGSRNSIDFYSRNDVSVRANPENTSLVIANTLEDLSLRQNRFGHAVSGNIQQAFPFNIHKNSAVYFLRMPTILETSHRNWDASESFAWNLANCTRPNPLNNPNALVLEYHDIYGLFPPNTNSAVLPQNTPACQSQPFIDFWEHPFPWSALAVSNNVVSPINSITGTPLDLTGQRYAEDVILTNVISFDVQVWDEIAGRYVNMGEAPNGFYADGKSAGLIGRQGYYSLNGGNNAVALPCVYDTWSEEYEREGYQWPDQTGTLISTQGRDQTDNDGNGVIDDIGEWTTPPPYNVPLRGVKITIRAFDPLSKNVREMTVVHSFK